MRFFDGDREVVGTVLATAEEAGRCATADVRVRGPISVGAIGMFDVGVGRFVGKRFHCRACDDLAGAAAALCTLVDLARKPADCDVCVLLTRGEEEGFIGAIASVLEPTLLRPTDRMISIETSAEQPVAQQGKGVVLRVGDRTSVFHSAFGRFLFDAATTLAGEDKTFRFQRALMPGGTCEGTVFDAWGYTTAAVCVALGNYHNMDRAKGRIAAETRSRRRLAEHGPAVRPHRANRSRVRRDARGAPRTTDEAIRNVAGVAQRSMNGCHG